MGINTDRSGVLHALQAGEILLQGQFLNGSNYTFLTQLVYEKLEMNVVYKPVKGEQPLWDFPRGTLGRREVAAFLVSDALGWDLVPPTIFRKKAPLGPGSIQQYIEHDPSYHYFNFSLDDRQRLRPVVIFDFLINNADRKGSHILMDPERHIWLIDHGISFHIEDKLRTVIWDFAGDPISQSINRDLDRFLKELEEKNTFYALLKEMIAVKEIAALAERVRYLLNSGCFPEPGNDRRVFPWPPI
jgi:uncharacterized repeat protein (TIGR03843 family)